MGVLLANMMLISVVFGICLLYLLNWNNEYVQKATNKMLSTSISVYCSVLVNESLMGVLKLISKLVGREIEITFGLMIFLGIYATVWFLCVKKRDDDLWLPAL